MMADLPLRHVEAFLADHPSVRHVCLNLTDFQGIERTRIMSSRQALQTSGNPNHPDGASTGGPCSWAVTRYQSILPSLLSLGQTDHWIPDWSTIKLSAKQDDMAEVECNVKGVRPTKPREGEDEWESVESPDGDFSEDPRVILRRIEDDVKEKHGIEFKVGYEIEFLLTPSIHADHTIKTPGILYSSEAIREKSFQVILDAAKHLEANGVGIWNYHHELGGTGGGKFELSLSPFSPSLAADYLLYSMRTIKDIAHHHGYFATMHPHPFEIGPTAGQHIHFSLNEVDLAPQFITGVLSRMEQLMAFFLSGYDSYTKDRQDMFGGGWIYWSHSKMTPAKEVTPGHWEFRMPDTFCSPHLQLAALISAGIEGIENKVEPVKAVDGAALRKMSDEEKKKLGIRRGPTSLEGAIAALEENESRQWWQDVIGKRALDGYIVNRKAEVAAAENMTYAQRTKALFWGPKTMGDI